jgi:hypothetical protein
LWAQATAPGKLVREAITENAGEVNQDAQLGFAMKEVYSDWRARGFDVRDGHRARFIDECVATRSFRR